MERIRQLQDDLEGLNERTAVEVAEARQRYERHKQGIITDALEEVADILALEEYAGDVDDTLIHHFDRAAFDPETVKPYLMLASEIAEKGADGQLVPVMLNHFYGEAPSYEFGDAITITFVDPKGPIFKSVSKHSTDKLMHAFTGETGSTTMKSLELVGSTVIFPSSLTTRVTTNETGYSTGVELRRSTTADDYNPGPIPSEYEFSGHTKAYFDGWQDTDFRHYKPLTVIGVDDIDDKIMGGELLKQLPRATMTLAGILEPLGEGLIDRFPKFRVAVEASRAYLESTDIK